MFTGIITALGVLERFERGRQDARASIKPPWDCAEIALGSSIACDGVCLTVVARGDEGFSVDISEETLAITRLDSWRLGQKINLEKALKFGDEFGGHIVSGHVDGVAEVADIEQTGKGYRMRLLAPAALMPMLAVKGSVALDGVALTVNVVDEAGFEIMVIPHTWEQTTLSQNKLGDRINLEVDMLARYVMRVLSFQREQEGH